MQLCHPGCLREESGGVEGEGLPRWQAQQGRQGGEEGGGICGAACTEQAVAPCRVQAQHAEHSRPSSAWHAAPVAAKALNVLLHVPAPCSCLQSPKCPPPAKLTRSVGATPRMGLNPAS